MRVITLAKCKALLGLTDTTYDTRITTMIPIIDAKVKQITSNRFNQMVIGDITIDSQDVIVRSYEYENDDYYYRNRPDYLGSGINNPNIYDTLTDYIQVGQLIEGEGIPADTYIEEVYYNDEVPYIKLSANATSTTAGAKIYLGINIAYQDIIAKGVMYMINRTNSNIPGNSVQSVGTVTYSSSDSKIDNKYGMPAWFVKGLPRYVRGY